MPPFANCKYVVDMGALTRRQADCLDGVANHLDSQQIAERLGISPHTVDGHIAVAMRTLGARTRREAVGLWKAEQAGETFTGQFSPVPIQADPQADSSITDRVEEERSHFVNWSISDGNADERNLPIRPIQTIGLVITVAAALAIVILSITPMIEGARRLAKLIN